MKTNQSIWFVLSSNTSSNPYSCFAFHPTPPPHPLHSTFAPYPQGSNPPLPNHSTSSPTVCFPVETGFAAVTTSVPSCSILKRDSKADCKELLLSPGLNLHAIALPWHRALWPLSWEEDTFIVVPPNCPLGWSLVMAELQGSTHWTLGTGALLNFTADF